MAKIAIVTDSTAYLPTDYLDKYPIRVTPQSLNWDGETYQDGVDIQPAEFYARLKTARIMPTTSQVSPGAFTNLFTELLQQDYQILAVLISQHLSGTLDSAYQARALMPRVPIEIIDSHTSAMAMGFLVLAAARAAEQGASLEECKALVEQARSQVGVLFVVDTLDFLHRGGRIGGASHLLGTMLNIKPILEVAEGRVEPVEKVRTKKKALARMVEVIQGRINGQRPIRLAVVHANAEEEACQTLAEAQKQFETVETVLAAVSPVIGTHTGPGTVGLAYMAGC